MNLVPHESAAEGDLITTELLAREARPHFTSTTLSESTGQRSLE
jgi:hypothetical protein